MHIADDSLRRALDPIPGEWEDRPGRHAAVLAALLRIDGADHLLFTERQRNLPEHAGQVAFPGGVREPGETPAECALRESREEIGLAESAVQLLGALPARNSSSDIRVQALVGRAEAGVELRPEPGEVATIFFVPVTELLRTDRWQQRAYHRPDGSRSVSTPHFQFERHLIWGLTGCFARDLIQTVRAVDAAG